MDNPRGNKSRCSKCLKSIVTKYISRHQETCKGFQKCSTCQKVFRSLAQHRRYCPPTAPDADSVTSSSLTPAGSLSPAPAQPSPRVTPAEPASAEEEKSTAQSSTGRGSGRPKRRRRSALTESDGEQEVDQDGTVDVSLYSRDEEGPTRDLRRLDISARPPTTRPSLLLRLAADASKAINSAPPNASRKRSAAIAELNESLNDMTELTKWRPRDSETEESPQVAQSSDDIRKLELQVELRRMEMQEAREAREHQQKRDREEYERDKEIGREEWERQKEREREERAWQNERDREKREHQKEMKRMDLQAESEREKLKHQKEIKRMELQVSADAFETPIA